MTLFILYSSSSLAGTDDRRRPGEWCRWCPKLWNERCASEDRQIQVSGHPSNRRKCFMRSSKYSHFYCIVRLTLLLMSGIKYSSQKRAPLHQDCELKFPPQHTGFLWANYCTSPAFQICLFDWESTKNSFILSTCLTACYPQGCSLWMIYGPRSGDYWGACLTV